MKLSMKTLICLQFAGFNCYLQRVNVNPILLFIPILAAENNRLFQSILFDIERNCILHLKQCYYAVKI